MNTTTLTRDVWSELKPLGLVWIYCPYPVLSAGLKEVLRPEARIHCGRNIPSQDSPSCIIFCPYGENVVSEVRRLRASVPGVPVLVMGSSADLGLASAAIQAGAQGFIHAQMNAEEILHTLFAIREGGVVAPGQLLEDVPVEETSRPNLATLSPQKLKILELTAEGLTNAQIACQLFLTESTIKQHLRAAYRALGVRNRTQAANLIREYRQEVEGAFYDLG